METSIYPCLLRVRATRVFVYLRVSGRNFCHRLWLERVSFRPGWPLGSLLSVESAL